jgi:hypothetical protein
MVRAPLAFAERPGPRRKPRVEFRVAAVEDVPTDITIVVFVVVAVMLLLPLGPVIVVGGGDEDDDDAREVVVVVVDVELVPPLLPERRFGR